MERGDVRTIGDIVKGALIGTNFAAGRDSVFPLVSKTINSPHKLKL